MAFLQNIIRTYRLFLPLAVLGAVSCTQKEPFKFTAPEFEAHIAVLASDEYQGRLPFTEGETKTIAYLQDQFKKIGLEPGNGESYLQEVPMVEITATTDPEMVIKGKRPLTLQGREDFVLWTEQTTEAIDLKDADIVFAGFGVIAPEYNWNDYEGIDVKGKIVLVLVNDPGFGGSDSTFFKGNTMTYYGRWTYKFEEAARQGASACLVIHNTVPAGYAFNVPQNNWNTPHLYLDDRGSETPKCDAIGWISMPATEKLFAAMGLNFAEHQSAARKPGFKAIATGQKASVGMTVASKYNMSYNLIGKITGKTSPDEYVLYSAHWDHVGVGRADESGDTIYNGAEDNASGTAGLLELARAFKSGEQPSRSILFVAVTAEEQGLQGSAYYAQNPVYPASQTVANINIDGLSSYGLMKDIVVIGRGQSDLEDYLMEAAFKYGRYVSPDPSPEKGYYFRSDHFNFAKAGVPALFTGTGIDHAQKGKDFGLQLQDEFLTKHYHQPSDEYDSATWNSNGALADLTLLFEIGKRMAYGAEWPAWKDGSEFKSLRSR
jgi:Zn-dependent M28 family amino/carboxypeptidase